MLSHQNFAADILDRRLPTSIWQWNFFLLGN